MSNDKSTRGVAMTRIMGLNVLPEMLTLWLIETTAVALAFYTLLHRNSILVAPDGLTGATDSTAAVYALLLALTVGLVGVATGLYRLEICSETRWMFVQTAVSAAVSLPTAWLVAKLMHVEMSATSDAWPLEMLMAWALLLFATRLVYRTALNMNLFVRHVAVLGAPHAVARTIEAINRMSRVRYRVQSVPVAADQPDGGAMPARLPDGLWGVVVAGADVRVEMPRGTRRFDEKTFWEDQLGRIDLDDLAPAAPDVGTAAGALPAVIAPAIVAPTAPSAALARRILDIALAAFLLLLTAPLLLLTTLLIRIESPGPAIYRQERVGLGGRIFTLWKFRSMRDDAERNGPIWASVGDPRVTNIGRLIRKLRIDELPQLVNVLRGEMSVIGPRPERPHFVERLAREIPAYEQRVRVKPGLTGWAQVNYPYGASVEDARAKLSYDLYYIKHRSLLFDLLILLSTVRVILF